MVKEPVESMVRRLSVTSRWPVISALWVLSVVGLLGFTPAPESEERVAEKEPLALSYTEAKAKVRHAATAAMERDVASARAELAFVLEHSRENPQALLVLACMELDSGRYDEAAQLIARLEQAAPGHQEVEVLRGLLALRKGHPELGWRKAYLQVWRKHGSPDLSRAHLLPEDLNWGGLELDEALWRRSESSPEARVAALLVHGPEAGSKHWHWLVQQLPVLKDPALSVMAIEVLRTPSPPEPLRTEMEEAAGQKLALLARKFPRDMQLRLLATLGSASPDTPLTSEELTALEAVAALPEWRQRSFQQVFVQVRNRLVELGVRNPSPSAFSAAVWYLSGQGPSLLLQRAKASREQLSPGDLKRLSRVLWQVGGRLADQSVLVEHMVGLTLMATSADWRGDAVDQRYVEERRSVARTLLNGSMPTGFSRWPLRSLIDEVTETSVRDERAHLFDFRLETPPEDASEE
jgi:hypothetical protein